jgi:O-antigen/teichoic acid export membrane protein
MPHRLGRNILANIGSVVAFIASAAVSVPLILDELGLAAYGVWTIALTLLTFITTAEAGLGPSVQRFVAVARGEADVEEVRRLAWTTLALYLTAGALCVALAVLGASLLVSAFDTPAEMRADAEAMYRAMGGVIALALVVAGLGNVQQGLERFVPFATAAGVSALAYLGALGGFLAAGEGLVGLAYAAGVQQAVMIVLRCWNLRDVLLGGRPALVRRARAGEVVSFAARLQVTVLAVLVNSQTDKLVVGAVAPATTVGQLGIGAQVAESGRHVIAGAFSPITSRLSTLHGEERRGEAARGLFGRLNRLWISGLVGVTAVGVASIYPLIAGWLGAGHGEAALLGAFLVIAYGAGLLPATSVAYLRAVGKPGLEARLGIMTIVLNVALTIPLGIAVGAVGVVAATMAAHVGGAAWFLLELRQRLPAELGAELLSPLWSGILPALAAGLAALAWGLAMNELLPTGVSLLPVAAGATAALFAYFAHATGTRPTPRALRTLLA